MMASEEGMLEAEYPVNASSQMAVNENAVQGTNMTEATRRRIDRIASTLIR
jgi:hypothetical protein